MFKNKTSKTIQKSCPTNRQETIQVSGKRSTCFLFRCFFRPRNKCWGWGEL